MKKTRGDEGAVRKRRWRAVSPITRRLLTINLVALAIPIVGLLYLEDYRRGLIESELKALQVQARLFAAALGEGAVTTSSTEAQELRRTIAHQMVRRMVETTRTRARLFAIDGTLVADSRLLLGSGRVVQVEELPPPSVERDTLGDILEVYDRLTGRLPWSPDYPPYREGSTHTAADYAEAVMALNGDEMGVVRSTPRGGLILSIGVPVQRYKQVLGGLLLSKDSQEIDAAVREVREEILRVFAIAIAATVLMSIYLAGTIARPLRRLAAAADLVRHTHARQHVIPEFPSRNDEIADLAEALRDMTQALWLRMDAIERFAADVAHEIKNPLTSLRSAVETASRIKDPEQQRRLMDIILEDVGRLDRLISDISDASRLDAELSRAEQEPINLSRLLEAMTDLYTAAREADGGGDAGPTLAYRDDGDGGPSLFVSGMEGRLVQVFRNLIGNAMTFSPPGGVVTLSVARIAGAGAGTVEVAVEDQGPGIPPGKEEAIFERFYTERPEGEKFGTHSGLGLSISKQIVEAHGGTLHAENRLAEDGRVRGARFVVRLPLLPGGIETPRDWPRRHREAAQ
ncbi:MAG: stimulus-sensing domain-containing protein [Hyphomicrobiales bacterium]|nr:stimulus-sensing domain-containing protein [Hyphomicrobiales bacterium]MCP5374152.1 stimulus-sensing domain-containing protein [Hyphomicrobiales bacterium]